MPTAYTPSSHVELKIRGKRSRRVAQRSDGSVPAKGRPVKRASELATTKKRARYELLETQKQQASTAASLIVRNMLSQLETLPIELIQLIFLHSLEVNLARASPTIAKSLSKESIYTALILFAFFDDDGDHPVATKSFALARYRQLDLAEKLRLQTSIMGCRWCTLERLQQTMPVLSRLAMVQAWHEENEREFHDDVYEIETPPITPSPALSKVAQLPSSSDFAAVEQHFLARSSDGLAEHEDHNRLYATYLPRIRTWTSKDSEGQTYKTVDGARGVFNARYIPDRLLKGKPWTSEKIKYLQFVRQGWRFLQKDFMLKISPSAMFEGMASAIAEHNLDGLKVLLELHFAAFQDQDSHTSVSAAGRVRYAVSFSHPIPLELFHLATREQEKSAQIVSLLLREGIDSIPKDDAVMTRWAIRGAASDEEVAIWLLRHLEGTQDYGLGTNGSTLFVNGNMTWRRSAGTYPFPEMSFTNEIGYLRGGAVDFRPRILEDLQ